MKVLVKYRSMSTSTGRVRNGDIVDLPEAEVQKILKMKPLSLEALPELPTEKSVVKKPAAKRTRAKKNVKPVE